MRAADLDVSYGVQAKAREDKQEDLKIRAPVFFARQGE